jgi:hypothetical protein
MTPLKIAAASTLLLRAGAQAEPLRPRLKELLADPPRRINRLIELTLLGANGCMRSRRPDPHCPVYLAVTHGSVADNVALVGGVAARNAPPTPVSFINLSSNMAGFYVASTLGLHGSNQSVAAEDFSFEAALELATLGARRAQALIGAVEECAWPLEAHRARLGLGPARALSESSHWLFVDQHCAQPLATVQWVRRYAAAAQARAALARERWPDGMVADGLAEELESHSGHWPAYRICRFIETARAPALLHVHEGRHGCYAVYVTKG